jgi:hypothetical protein
MLGQGYGTSQHPNKSEISINMKNLKKPRRKKNFLRVTSIQVTLNLTPAEKPLCNNLSYEMSCTWCMRIIIILYIYFFGITILVEP